MTVTNTAMQIGSDLLRRTAFPRTVRTGFRSIQFCRARGFKDEKTLRQLLRLGLVYCHREGEGLRQMKRGTTTRCIQWYMQSGRLWLATGKRAPYVKTGMIKGGL